MNKPARSRLVRWALILAILSVVVVGVESWMSGQTRKLSRTISDALRDAKSVTFVEFERASHHKDARELVFQRAKATPQQIEQLREATAAWFAPMPSGEAACFMPHHRVEIVRKDGSELRFVVCFMCDNFTLSGHRGGSLPTPWRSRLAQMFSDAGMAPRKDYGPLIRLHPDYDAFSRE